ncbi:TPA: glycosyltransferase [Vibrio parahaemolyticus]|nr:glycosyltransferase family 2 protein [Vibrio parahaemolyticus]EIO2934328.1 glycosyltransferase family 2 protein [Vibrio parahaemolyticus]EJE4224985.1 glycosyltransferase family 2 protein [Vibrio parahaemolyticus]MDF5525322.1 glycosyltransferase family 2 protein [Vibrio parahaemolyticus]MDF5552157.1 glycosyltransferase family 2 protein [Vibrio parahaemolyticus]
MNKISSSPKLSICVCTFNRERFLRLCLESIIEQIEGNQNVELIVINNNSTDGTKEYLKKLSLEKPYIRCFDEVKQGLSHAKNKARKEFFGEWLAFIDDDAILSKSWLKIALNYISMKGFDIIGGPYDPWYLDGKVDWYQDVYGSNRKWLPYREDTKLERKSVSGGNMIISRRVLTSIDFDVSKGMVNNVMSYGEETLFQEQARKKGYKIIFVPSLMILHYVPLQKQTKEYFFERARVQGIERMSNKNINANIFVSIGVIIKLCIILLRTIAKNIYMILLGKRKFYNLYLEMNTDFLYYKNFFLASISHEKK